MQGPLGPRSPGSSKPLAGASVLGDGAGPWDGQPDPELCRRFCPQSSSGKRQEEGSGACVLWGPCLGRSRAVCTKTSSGQVQDDGPLVSVTLPSDPVSWGLEGPQAVPGRLRMS